MSSKNIQRNIATWNIALGNIETITMFSIKSFTIKPTQWKLFHRNSRIESFFFFIVSRISLLRLFFSATIQHAFGEVFFFLFFLLLSEKLKLHFSWSWVLTVNAWYLKSFATNDHFIYLEISKSETCEN